MKRAMIRKGGSDDKLIKAVFLACVLSTYHLINAFALLAASTGASFLKIDVGARAAGMGSAYVAAEGDVSVLHWNPAGLARLREAQLSATHAEWISDLRHDFVGAAFPTASGAVALSAGYLSQSDLERRDASGARAGAFEAYDGVAALSLSRAVSPRAGVGLSLKYVEQKIDTEKASGIALDGGVRWAPFRSLALGAAVRNLGSDMRFLREDYRLPLSVSAGLSLSWGVLTLSAEARREVYEKKTLAGAGVEYVALGGLALRAGYHSLLAGGAGLARDGFGAGDPSSDRLSGLGMGVGLRLFGQRMDYAFTPYGDLGAAQRLSLTFRF